MLCRAENKPFLSEVEHIFFVLVQEMLPRVCSLCRYPCFRAQKRKMYGSVAEGAAPGASLAEGLIPRSNTKGFEISQGDTHDI